ncbi:MAG: thiamine-phosphate kinase, partial [Candidatus Dormibacterales bacterium]
MTSLGELGESGLLEAIRPSLAVAGKDLLVGPGEDDAAAWREPEGVLVATSDAFVEGVHFDRRWLRPAEIGWRCLALALGDLACKGAAPSQALVCLALTPGWSVEEVTELYSGIAALAGRTGPALVGGDLVASPHEAVVCITALGRARWPVVPRSAARPGWKVA